jgi:hypothetical protein
MSLDNSVREDGASSAEDIERSPATKKNQEDYRGVSNVCVGYVSFQEPKPYKPRVDRTVFYPLYVATVCLLLLPVLPFFLMILLVTIWAILFVATPVYYFYHFDPLDTCCSPTCVCKTEHPDAVGGAFA